MIIYLFSHNVDVNREYKKLLTEKNEFLLLEESEKVFDSDFPVDALVIFHVESYSGNILHFMQHVKKEKPHQKVFVITHHPRLSQGATLLKMGVVGYANSFLSPPLLQQAIEIIRSGNAWVYPELMQYIIAQIPVESTSREDPLSGLTQKEQEVAELVSKGMSNKMAAHMMGVSEITIKKHLSSIYAKLGLKDRIALALSIKSH